MSEETKTVFDDGPALVVRSDQELTEKLAVMREAQAKFATYTQEQVDKIFYEAAMAANKARIPLAEMAVEETGMGLVEDKVIKNHYASEYIYNAYKDTKTCGVIEEDKAGGIKRVAEPIGVIGAVIPTTNPTSTAIFKCLIALKTRNAIMISPHPRAKKCTAEAARIVNDAAVAAGAPEHLIGWIEALSLENTNTLMAESDIILATGGPGMVKAAYSSGTPALGVGAGNTPVIIDDTADVIMAVNSIIHSKTFDNGMICASEQSVTVVGDEAYAQAKAEFERRGCYFLNDEELDKVRKTIIINGRLNAKIVGQRAATIAGLAGIEVPASTKILIGEVESVDISEEFAHEKLSPVLAMYKAADFDEAIAKAERLVADGGYGHTSSLYIDVREEEKIQRHYEAMKTCRILINTPSSHGGIGDLYNFHLAPSLTLGCGSWGGNSVSENVGVKHLINIKTVAERRENMLWFRTPEKVYFKKGCMSVALDELGTMGKKRAFIVTDQFLYKSGFTKSIEEQLDKMGIVHSSFWNVEPDPKLHNAQEGVRQLEAFEPDTIIAVGGGSAMDAAKIMWLMYEHPEAKFEDMAMDFMDIRKRIFRYPELGSKCYFVAIPTSSGTGSEVTPFAIITEAETGVKWPLADYALLPNMAIVDTDNMMSQPKGLTSASGVDVLTHALEAFVSIMASDYTNPLALEAGRLVFTYLARAYDNPDDVEARDHMANASCLAGMAFANAFLGVNHSMAHKLGAFHHIPHGWANAVILTRVMRYNAAERPTKMGTFSQYQRPQAKERYCRFARYCGFTGANDDEVFENFIAGIEELKAHVGVKPTIAAFGVDEQYFLDTLDDMSKQAFNDQCTGANPRYPLISEIRELYLDAYYDRPASSYED